VKTFYYPGCASQHLARDLHRAVEALLAGLELEVEVLEDWNCCGAREVAGLPSTVGWFLAARNLALVEEGQLVATCSLCYHNLKKVARRLREDSRALERVNTVLREEGLILRPERVRVLHLLEFLGEREIFGRMLSELKGRGEGKRVAVFYGCFLSRPFSVEADLMERVLGLCGFEVVSYPLARYCCGGHLPRTDSPVIRRLCERLLYGARRSGAHFLAVCCPVCKTNLEVYGSRDGPEVVYLPRILAQRLGVFPPVPEMEDAA